MENPTYPIAETGMYYKNEDGTIYWDIFVGEDLERITGDVVLEISISGDDYLVQQLPSNTMPPRHGGSAFCRGRRGGFGECESPQSGGAGN